MVKGESSCGHLVKLDGGGCAKSGLLKSLGHASCAGK
jgi:hypothetical protein